MTRPIDPVSLQHFVAVCEERSIARAAARESLVASALSKRMTALEAELGTPLLVRRRGGIEPTAAGEALLGRAREVLFALERLRADLGEFAHGVQGNVRVLASPSVLAERLPDDVAAFLAQHPGVRVRLDEGYSADIVRAVREGQADLGVLWDQADLEGLQRVPYSADRLCVAMAPQHPLARRVSLTFAETLDQPSISVGPGGQLDALLRRQAALLGRTPAQRMQVAALEAACRMVAAGLGLAITPQEATAPYAGAGRLVLVRLKEPWALRRFVLVARTAPAPTATAALLIEHLRKAASKASAGAAPAAASPPPAAGR